MASFTHLMLFFPPQIIPNRAEHSMPKIAKTDIAILGGGVAGLWLLNRLRQSGYSAILLESNTLGGAQTTKSQGIIHGGMKYALQGKLTEASQKIADMPTVWKQCLQGEGDIDLTQVPVLSPHQYLWSSSKIAGKLTGFLANVALQGRVTQLPISEYPSVFQHKKFKGIVYALDEMVIDSNSLVRELVKPNQDVIFKIDAIQASDLQFNAQDQLTSIKVKSDALESVEIQAQQFIFTAGAGNEILLKAATQRRPLHMVVVKTDFSYPVYAHCFGLGSTPRITITTHTARDGKTIWYLGGQIAEDGVKLDAEKQVATAKKELAALFPWLDFSNSLFASFRIDRAEPAQPGGKRPDDAVINEIENYLVAWPTKLALAPKLADEILQRIKQKELKQGPSDISALRGYVLPAYAQPIWDELLC